MLASLDSALFILFTSFSPCLKCHSTVIGSRTCFKIHGAEAEDICPSVVDCIPHRHQDSIFAIIKIHGLKGVLCTHWDILQFPL